MIIDIQNIVRQEKVICRGKNYILPILYEDNHIITIIKPIGILSQGDKSGDIDCLELISEYLKSKYNKLGNAFVGLVHRLDRNTGGTMVFAKTSKGASRLSAQLRDGDFHKLYIAITQGNLKERTGKLYHKLEKNEKTNKVVLSEKGKECVLKYHNLSTEGNNGCYCVCPITGRTHQIRAQFSLSGVPLCGDSKYGEYKGKNMEKLCLWSYIVFVKHPVFDKYMLFSSLPQKNVPNLKYWFEYKCYNEKKISDYLSQIVENLNKEGTIDIWSL